MINKLSPKDQNALKIGAVLAALILIFVYIVSPWLDHWAGVREQLEQKKQILAKIILDDSPAAQARSDIMLHSVPAFEMPQKEDEQRLIFVRKFSEQVQKAGIKLTEMPQYHSHIRIQPKLGLKILRLHCCGKCNFSQALKLLAVLRENPYLVSIEDMQLKCDPKKRQEMELILTVSTFAR